MESHFRDLVQFSEVDMFVKMKNHQKKKAVLHRKLNVSWGKEGNIVERDITTESTHNKSLYKNTREWGLQINL